MTKIGALVLLLVVSLVLAVGGSYMAVVSQNPAGQPAGAATNYGPISP